MVAILTQISDLFLADRQLVYIINKLMADDINSFRLVPIYHFTYYLLGFIWKEN